MTIQEMAALTNYIVAYSPVSGLEFQCTVKDVRKVFDRIDILIVPCDGGGEAWVSLDSVRIEK